MNQNPINPDAADASPAYHLPLDATSRDELVAALRLAEATAVVALDCRACTAGDCPLPRHQQRLAQIHSWRQLATGIGRLPDIGSTEPLIRFDPDACRTWLEAGAAKRAGIDEEFNSDDFTIAAGLEELLSLLNSDPCQPAWKTAAHLVDVQIWRTADSDGIDGGGVLTADLTYLGERVRLASLHQGSDEFTDGPATSGIDAAVQALGHVAATINREYANFRHATAVGHHPAGDNADAQDVWTVVGVWVDDEPVPVGVIAGQHDVSGGDDFEQFPQGVWATSVTADDDFAAEQAAVEIMRADNDDADSDDADDADVA